MKEDTIIDLQRKKVITLVLSDNKGIEVDLDELLNKIVDQFKEEMSSGERGPLRNILWPLALRASAVVLENILGEESALNILRQPLLSQIIAVSMISGFIMRNTIARNDLSVDTKEEDISPEMEEKLQTQIQHQKIMSALIGGTLRGEEPQETLRSMLREGLLTPEEVENIEGILGLDSEEEEMN